MILPYKSVLKRCFPIKFVVSKVGTICKVMDIAGGRPRNRDRGGVNDNNDNNNDDDEDLEDLEGFEDIDDGNAI